MIKDLLKQQREYLNHYFDHVDVAALEKMRNILKECAGMIFITGIGKSGLVAKKIATTMTSVNIKALYLSPTDALHGDIGILSSKDIFIFLSKSGESDELLQLIPSLRTKGVQLLAVVSKKGSHLAKACDFEMVLPLLRELGTFDLMPTTSAVTQMLFGDLLTVSIMEETSFSIEEYRRNHPAGRIGKRMTLKVKDLMINGSALPITSPHQKISNVLVELSDKRSGCLLVVDEEMNLLGIFTDGDLRRTLERYGAESFQKSVFEVMTKTPRTTHSETMAVDAMHAMEKDQKRPIMMMPVVDQGKVVGLIRMHDILQSGIQ